MNHVRREISCCGIREYDGLRPTPQQNLTEFIQDYLEEIRENEPYAFVIFSDNHTADRGQAFANLIKKEKLGTIAETRKILNPNTHHKLKAWIWGINEKKLRAWAKINCPSIYNEHLNLIRRNSY